MTTPPNLSTLETDLAVLATPNPAPATGGGTADATGVLTAVQGLFTALESVPALQPAIGQLATGINGGLSGAADALDGGPANPSGGIAGQLKQLAGSLPAGTDAATVLTSLQNALSTAGSLVPGSTNVAALQSGSQFFSQLSSLLTGLGTINDAVTCLYQIAQELRAIGSLPS